MIREIKFRVYSDKHGMFFPGAFSTNQQSHQVGFSGYELMQFTGLLDKNDTEIYENDIVRILYTDWSSKDEKDPRTLEEYLNDIAYIGKVVFNPYYGWRVEDIGGINYGEYGFIEVIGNVHENPELLEK